LTSEFKNKPANVEFLGLAFERKNDRAYAFSRIAVVKKKLFVPYPIVFAGPSNKDLASKRLPAIAPISAFPTTVFLRKDHSILKVHSGFSGPATGKFYETWKAEFKELLEELGRE